MDDTLFTTDDGRRRLAEELLPAWISSRRWFGGKARSPRKWNISRWEFVKPGWLVALDVEYEDRSTETYAVPLRLVSAESTFEPGALVARDAGTVLIDATHDPDFRAALFGLMVKNARSTLSGKSSSRLEAMFAGGEIPPSRVLDAEQSNTSLIYGEKLFVKFYRRLVAGVNPDGEITRVMGEQTTFRNGAAFCGAIEWDGAALALGVENVTHQSDGWRLALHHFGETAKAGQPSDAWLALAKKLGQRTGEMHRALAGLPHLPEFAPEPIEPSEIMVLLRRITRSAALVSEEIRARIEQLPREIRPVAEEAIRRLASLDPPGVPRIRATKIRIHGDYHLGQVLFTGDDFVIMDFEGEPARSLDERRAKHPALRDVAGMLRSLHYAAHAAGGGIEAAESWAVRSQQAFLEAWKAAVAGSVIACDPVSERELLRLFLIEKALYEVAYELNNRPGWLAIPLRGVLALL